MGDIIGGLKKMGAGNLRHSVAQVLLASTLMMLVATSHCMMSTTTTAAAAAAAASNSTAASSTWCDGHIVDGHCILISQAYGGGEHLVYLDLDVMDRMVVAEYDDSGETSSRRVLDGAGKTNIYRAVRSRGEFCSNQMGQRYTCQNTPNNNRRSGCQNLYNRDCQM